MDENQKARRRWVGLVLVLLGAFGFSAKAIFIKLAYAQGGQVDAITLMALRMLLSLPFFLVVAVWRREQAQHPPLAAGHWLLLGWLGLLGYYLASYLDFLGLQYISAGLERVILFLYPTFVVLMSAVLGMRGIAGRVALALLLSYAGMVLAFAGNLDVASVNIWRGSALVLASAVVFAVFTVGSGELTPRIGSSRFTAYTMTVACIATLAHFAAQRNLTALWTGLPTVVYFLAGLMAIFSTVLPAFFMNAGIQRLGAGSAAIVSTIGPMITLALAYWVLHEAVGYLQLAGTALVLAGVYTVGKMKAAG